MNQFKVEVIWVVTPCSVAVGYWQFRGPCCLHLQGEDGLESSPPWKPQILQHEAVFTHLLRPFW